MNFTNKYKFTRKIFTMEFPKIQIFKFIFYL